MKRIRIWGAAPEPRLEPPEYDEPTELDDVKEEVPLNLDIYVKATDETIDFMVKTKSGLKGDLQWDWAKGNHKDGSWSSEEYPSVTLSDLTGMVEHVGDLLVKFFDEKEIFDGYWHVVADAKLIFELSNIQELDDEIIEDEIDVKYLESESTVDVSFFEEVNEDGEAVESEET
jgi:hypothetical protein